MRTLRIGLLPLVLTVGLALSPAGVSVAAKAPCASQKKALKRATGDAKKRARLRYNTCLRAAKDAALAADIKRQLSDQRLVGRRGDGQSVNWLFCTNGKYKLSTTDRSGTGISTGDRWVVTQVSGSATTWTAIIRQTTNLRAGGLSVGLARKGSQYFVGIARGVGQIDSQGAVTRTADAAGCAAL
jgi:hypothetical protein